MYGRKILDFISFTPLDLSYYNNPTLPSPQMSLATKTDMPVACLRTVEKDSLNKDYDQNPLRSRKTDLVNLILYVCS